MQASPEVIADYVSVVVNKERPTDVADARNVKSSSVSANVKRITRALKDGEAITVNGETWTPENGAPSAATAPTFSAFVAETYDADTALSVAMADDKMGEIDRDIKNADRAMEEATTKKAAAESMRENVLLVIGRMLPADGPTIEEMREAYAAHCAALATPDAESDADDADESDADDADDADADESDADAPDESDAETPDA